MQWGNVLSRKQSHINQPQQSSSFLCQWKGRLVPSLPRTDCLLGSLGPCGRLLFALCCPSAGLPTLLPGAEVPKACALLLFLHSCAGRGPIILHAALPAARKKTALRESLQPVGPGQLGCLFSPRTSYTGASPSLVRDVQAPCQHGGCRGWGSLACQKEGA